MGQVTSQITPGTQLPASLLGPTQAQPVAPTNPRSPGNTQLPLRIIKRLESSDAPGGSTTNPGSRAATFESGSKPKVSVGGTQSGESDSGDQVNNLNASLTLPLGKGGTLSVSGTKAFGAVNPTSQNPSLTVNVDATQWDLSVGRTLSPKGGNSTNLTLGKPDGLNLQLNLLPKGEVQVQGNITVLSQ